jgi:ferredoxin
MAHIVTAPCHDCKYTDCCVVCPVECFYQDDSMLYIDPNDCIDCEACVPECPVEAIYSENNVPTQWQSYIQLNKDRAANLKGAGHLNKERAEALKGSGGHITEKNDPKEGPGCAAKK